MDYVQFIIYYRAGYKLGFQTQKRKISGGGSHNYYGGKTGFYSQSRKHVNNGGNNGYGHFNSEVQGNGRGSHGGRGQIGHGGVCGNQGYSTNPTHPQEINRQCGNQSQSNSGRLV